MKAIIAFLTVAMLVISPNVCAAKAVSFVPAACHLTKTAPVENAHACCDEADRPSKQSVMTCCPLAAEIIHAVNISSEISQSLHREISPLVIAGQAPVFPKDFIPEAVPSFTSRIFAKTYSSNSPPVILNFAF